MYKTYETPYAYLPKSNTKAGPVRLAVDRIPVNGTYDKRIARQCRKNCKDDAELNVEVGDPVFVDIAQPTDSELFLFSNIKQAYSASTISAPARSEDKAEMAQDRLKLRNTVLERMRFIGFSETDIKCSEMNHMDIHICANTGGSLSVLCGESEGIRTNDNICIDLPASFQYAKVEGEDAKMATMHSKDRTPQTLVTRLVVRRYDTVQKEIDTLLEDVQTALIDPGLPNAKDAKLRTIKECDELIAKADVPEVAKHIWRRYREKLLENEDETQILKEILTEIKFDNDAKNQGFFQQIIQDLTKRNLVDVTTAVDAHFEKVEEKIPVEHYQCNQHLRLMGKCLQGGEFGHRIRILLRPTHIKRRSQEQHFQNIVLAYMDEP